MLVAILMSWFRPPLVEIAAIADTLYEANVQTGKEHYRVVLVSERLEPVPSAAGPMIRASATFADFSGPIDTVIVIPVERGMASPATPAAVDWLRAVAPRARRVGSACTGAFVLGQAGLLRGRRVTTHWQFAAELAALYPDAHVEADSIIVRDGELFSSAGVTSAFDLMLSLIEEDLGREVALSVARFFVMFLKRPAGQSQFSAQLAAQFGAHEPIHRTLQFIHDHLQGDLSIAALAREAGMSARTFARTFAQEAHMPPAAYVEMARVDAARRLLEGGKLPLKRVAFESGFSSQNTMRGAFLRKLDVTPGEYQRRFHSAIEPLNKRSREIAPRLRA